MRIPWTIWRYASLELWRLVLMTTAVVVTVLAFAATVKPLADGKLGTLEALRFMLLAVLPMLQYALPFAAGFGATLAYHRLAQDNELAAARVSGLSHYALLVPAAAAGLLLGGALSLTAGQLVPRFLRSMEEIITQDLTRMIMSTIDRGESLDFGGVQVHADRVHRLGPDPLGDAQDRLLLTKVAAVQLDRAGQVMAEVSARRAVVRLNRVDAGDDAAPPLTRIDLLLQDCRYVRTGESHAEVESLPVSFAMPGGLSDDVKFLTDGELRDLPNNPDRLNVIASRRRDLAYHIAREDARTSIAAELVAQKRVRLKDPTGERELIVRASGMRDEGDDWVLLPLGRGADARVEVEVMRGETGNVSLTRLSAEDARLSADIGRDINSRQLALKLTLNSVTAWGSEPDAGGTPAAAGIKSRTFGGLLPHQNPLPDLLAMSSAEILADARARIATRHNENIARPMRELSRRLERLWREVMARRHERAAMSVSVLIMVLTGAVTAVRLKGSLPLTVYLWSFFPGLLAVITVNAGQEAVRSTGPVGLIMLWGGVAALAGYALVTYLGIRRH